MKLGDLLYISVQNFKNRKSRSALTILGVSVGIGAILFLVSLGYGLQNMLLEKITTSDSLLALDIVSSEAKIVALNDETLKRIKELRNVDKVSPQGTLPAQMAIGDLSSETTLNLIDSDFFTLAGASPMVGRFFTNDDYLKIVINSPTAELFSLQPQDMLGKKMKFMTFLTETTEDGFQTIEPLMIDKEFEIVGIIEETSAAPEVYLKREEVPELPLSEYQSAKVKVTSDEFMEDVREKLINMGFLVSALSDTISQANKIFSAVQIVLSIFGIIALVVAAIGLINTMTIALLERTNEIGIMRAIGGAPKDIKRLFLGESLLIGFLGGVGGIIIGLIVAEVFNFGLNLLATSLGGQSVDLFYFPTWFLIFIMLLSTLVGLAGGYWPARRASKLHPLEALRYK